ncbi:VaFE repeat-containing surface-anchored protein [Corynebacterium vitaeruminis]|uniref:VaFE repeat-containing surface-anchored protein n=1 Tax=Corynebacterium vitaeruminis TaxID=38305 RepID=UPI00068B6D15|nr:VaFE repeat-containing surface-anchored protein [Corynebacterium vitaeruminis]
MNFDAPPFATHRGLTLAGLIALVIALVAAVVQPALARADSTYEAYATGTTQDGFYNVRPLGQDAAEIAYCMNVHFALPRTQRSGESLPQFSRIAATGDFAAYTEKKGERDLDSKLLTILWNGAPNDALGLVDSGVLTADELRRVTQKSLWYYTDGYISQDLLDGTSESAKLYRQMTHQARAGEEMTLAEYPSDAVLYVYTPNDSGTRWQTLLGAYFRHPSTREVIAPREESFSVEKRDAETKETLPGASLQLRSAAGDTYAWDSAATKENLQLAPGEYRLSETAAPASYEQPGTAPLATVTIAEDGTVTLGKHSPLVALEGKTLVVNNKKQSQPTLVTNAYDAAGGERDNLLPSTGGQVADMLTYTGLEAGKSYVVRGQLVDKATGQPTGVEKQETFIAETADGSHTVTFDVPASLAGTSLVAYEAIYAADDESHVVVQHADRDSAAQTVLVDSPEIPASITTKATVTGDNESNILPASGGSITDTVTYTGLETGHTYTLRGELMDKRTGASTGITAEKKFNVDELSGPDGEVSLDFTVGGEWAGHDLVVFETIIDPDHLEAASHKDLGAASQTIMVASEKEGFGWVIPLAIGALIGGALLAGSAVSSGSSGPSGSWAPAGSAAANASSAAPASSQAPVEAAATSAPAPTPTSPAVRLATTGASVLGILGISVALIIGGALVIARCRKG